MTDLTHTARRLGTDGAVTAGDLLRHVERQVDPDRARAPLATGFEPLDTTLEGGLRRGDLTLVAGPPGVGKTIATLQWARHLAAAGHRTVYVCYEHDHATLLGRLLVAEAAEAAPEAYGEQLADTRRRARRIMAGTLSVSDALAEDLLLRHAADAVAGYGDRLALVRGTATTDLATIERLLGDQGGAAALIVDYLQKMPAAGDDEERTTALATGLKDLALGHEAAVVAVTAVGSAGLVAPRVHLPHLRGSTALGYEADVVLLLNDKRSCVSPAHISYDTRRAAEFGQQVVMSMEKNRGGAAELNMEHTKQFANLRFDPDGRFVAEQLIEAPLSAGS